MHKDTIVHDWKKWQKETRMVPAKTADGKAVARPGSLAGVQVVLHGRVTAPCFKRTLNEDIEFPAKRCVGAWTE